MLNSAKSYIKWLGSKHRLLSQLAQFFPEDFNDYYEPFLGSGCVFFYIKQNDIFERKTRNYYLSDINKILVNCHKNVSENLKDMEQILSEYLKEEKTRNIYEEIRQRINDNDYTNDVIQSCDFIYLNKRCYGGLYRLNKKGHFNSAQDLKQISPLLSNEIYKSSKLFKNTSIQYCSYESVKPEQGSFIFLDPPYYPISKTSSFTGYSNSWKHEDHLKLLEYVKELDRNKVKFLMTNSDCDFVANSYSKYKIDKMRAIRYIDAMTYHKENKKNKRDVVSELIIRNY